MSTSRTSEAALSPAALGPVDVPLAADIVADRLRRAIHLGMFCAGERFPPSRELAERLGVSRVTVRAALQILQDAGYVATSRGASGGTEVVAADDIDTVARRAQLLARIDDISRIAEFRAIVEGGAAAMAADLRTATDIEQLEQAAQVLAGDEATVATFRRADAVLHLAVARIARNPMLERSIVEAREAMFTPIDVLTYRPVVDRTRAEHTAIVQAIVAGDGPRAQGLMAAHVQAGHAELRAILDLGPEPLDDAATP